MEAIISTMRDPATARSFDELSATFRQERSRRRQWLRRAQAFLDAGDAAAAESAYRGAINQAPALTDAWSGLAAALLASGRPVAALEAASRALDLNGRAAAPFHVLAGVASRDPSLEPAIRDVVDRISARDLDADPFETAIRRGNLGLLASDPLAAAEHYATAYRERPDAVLAAENMVVACTVLGQPARALAWEGLALHAWRDDAEAVAALRRALTSEDAVPIVALALGESLERLGDHDAAIATWLQATRRWPDEAAFYLRAAGVLQSIGRTTEAVRTARRGRAQCPSNFELALTRALMLPALYETEHEIARWRLHYERGLDRLTRDVPAEVARARELLGAIGSRTNFYLPYQGRNDRVLQQRYGEWVARVAARAYPQWAQAPAAGSTPPRERLRIGYASAHLHHHVVADLFGGWLKYADRSRFHVSAYYLGDQRDVVPDVIDHCDAFRRLPADLEAAAAIVSADRLDVLVYLDIGMHSRTTLLAALRLAPVQAVTWGHPLTSGLPTMDCFLSSEEMEPPDASGWYSETLVRLPGIGVAYPQLDRLPAPADRAALGLRPDGVMFFCGQSPFKYLPQYDALLVEIARRVAGAQFLFVASHAVAPRLRARLVRAFDAAGLDGNAAIRLAPALPWPDFLGAMAAADVFLDSVDWSGGHTTLEALSIGVPVATWPRGGVRGRHSAGMLSTLGVRDTIARSREDYVAIAARLATDVAWRREMSTRIRTNRARLFDDREPVRALERFYLDATSRARAGSF